jgi:membrane dipeptidase
MFLLTLLLALALGAGPSAAQSNKISDAEVRKVHQSVLLIDTHNDVPSDTVKGVDIGKRRDRGHTDLPRLREGGVGAVFFAAYVSADYVKRNQSAHRALEMIDTIRHDIVERYPNDFALALTADDIERAHRNGKIAALIGVEGGHAIEDSLRLLRCYYALGTRYMTLTHANTNDWADSSGDINKRGVKHHNGLTEFGRQVIREMNRLGMMVDISHVSDKTFWDALATSKAPIFASHSSCRSLSNIPRNMTDEMIVALAKKGGVIQINFGCEFVSQKSADGSPWSNPKIKAKRPDGSEVQPPRAALDDVAAQIDHVVKIAGIDAVGIGTDYDGVTCVPKGLEDVSRFPNLTRALLEHGYSAADIGKIYGGNFLRVMRAVETAAREARRRPPQSLRQQARKPATVRDS